jgi:hypothetical protein
MAVQVGSAHAEMLLKYDQFVTGFAAVESGIARLRALAAKPIVVPVSLPTPALPSPRGGGAGGGGGDPAREAQRLADSQRRAALAAADHAGKVQILNTALQGTSHGTIQYNNLLAQKFRAEQAAERASQSYASKLFDVKGALVGMVGAFGVANLAGMAFNAVVGEVKEGFELAKTLDTNRRALGAFIGDQTRANRTLQDASAFGRQYGFTQREISDAVASSSLLIKQSNAPIEQIIGTLARLQQLNPRETFEGASFAVKELASGDITSIAERFNISRKAAHDMADQIKAGADVFQVLDAYLTKTGITLDTLKVRMDGAAGASRQLLQAQEDLALATAEFAEGPGVKLIQVQTDATRGFTRLLGGAGGTAAIYRVLQQTADELTGSQERLGQSTRQEANAVQFSSDAYAVAERAQAKAADAAKVYAEAIQTSASQDLVATAKSDELKAAKERLAAQAQVAAERLIELGTIGAAEAARLAASSSNVDVLTAAYYRLAQGRAAAQQEAVNQQAFEDQRAGERSGGQFDTQNQVDREKARARTVANTQRTLAEAQRENAYAAATTAGKYAILRAELAKLTPGTVEYVKKQGEIAATQRQLASEQEAAAKRAGTAARKDAKEAEREAKAQEKADLSLLDTEDRLVAEREKLAKLNPASVEYKQTLKEIKDLEEKIADEKERQNKAAIDARLSAIDDRKDRRKEERELAQARRVLASGSTSAEQRAAAQDVLERIPLERAKRQQEIARQIRDAGGTVAPGATAARPGLPAVPGVATVPGVAGAGGVAVGAAAVGGVVLNLGVQVLLDGHEVAAVIHPTVNDGVILNLRAGLQAARAAGG